MIFFARVASSQSQFSFCKGDTFLWSGEYEAARKNYFEMISLKPSFKSVYIYNIACSFALDGQYDSAFHYISLSQNNQLDLNMLYDCDFISLHSDERWKGITEQQRQIFFRENENIKEKNVAWMLSTMGSKDQSLRRCTYYDRNKVRLQFLLEEQASIDDSNRRIFDSIVSIHGFPTNSGFGERAVNSAFLIIQHSDTSYQRKYLPTIQLLAIQKQINQQYYALLVDRYNVLNGKKQIYGTQIDLQGGECRLFPCEQPLDVVDKLRLEIGMSTIEEYVKLFNCKTWIIK